MTLVRTVLSNLLELLWVSQRMSHNTWSGGLSGKRRGPTRELCSACEMVTVQGGL
jgi:hypothetical protein